MKKLLFFPFFLLLSFELFAQPLDELRKIDSIVTAIKKSDLQIVYDTIVNNIPAVGLYVKSYLTTGVEGNELKFFVNRVSSTSYENDTLKEMVGSIAFYFAQGKLIKVEETLLSSGKEQTADWYYSNDKPLYWTLNSDKSESRAQFLLTLARDIMEKAGLLIK